MASGSRINKAADDAAGLAISENLRADVRSLAQAKRNANDGISLVQTAEGGLTETSNMLIRLRELAIQSASDTIGKTEREFTNRDLVLKDEIDRIANSTRVQRNSSTCGRKRTIRRSCQPSRNIPIGNQVGKEDYLLEADALGERNPVNIIKMDFSSINAYTEGEGSLNLGRAEEGTKINTKADAQQSIAARHCDHQKSTITALTWAQSRTA